MTRFAFNITGDAFTPTINDFILPNGWNPSAVNAGANAGDARPTNACGYGRFDVVVGAGGQNRQDPLTFSIAVGGDTINSYFGLSSGAGQPAVAFAAHVAGISTGAFTFNADSAAAACNAATDGSTCMELPSAWRVENLIIGRGSPSVIGIARLMGAPVLGRPSFCHRHLQSPSFAS